MLNKLFSNGRGKFGTLTTMIEWRAANMIHMWFLSDHSIDSSLQIIGSHKISSSTMWTFDWYDTILVYVTNSANEKIDGQLCQGYIKFFLLKNWINQYIKKRLLVNHQ